MFYRRKILLTLLQQFGGVLSKIALQKLLFLFCKNQIKPAYNFIPYKFGCYSFQANQDISTMIKYNQIKNKNLNWILLDKNKYIEQLKEDDKIRMISCYEQFKDFTEQKLIQYMYTTEPFYAINSQIAQNILNTEKYNNVLKYKPTINDNAIFTIGYEGISVEEYVNKLILNNIKVLCDVRKNPISMKYGFSKNQLKYILENIGIIYLHLPNLGIESNKRQELHTMEDYAKLFDDYEFNTLPLHTNEIQKLYDIFCTYKRIALTCFEAEPNCCHRSRTVKVLIEKYDIKYKVIDI